jgi:hypothetical protein
MASSDQDAALAGMAKQGRTPMNRDALKFTSPSASPQAGKLMAKNNSKSVDPAMQGTGIRQNVPYTGERTGASYKANVRYTKNTDPAAGLTQANGRIVSPAVVRQTDSFGQGVGTSY